MFKKACNQFRGEKGQVGRRHLAADLGRHKACPYGNFEREWEGDLWQRSRAGTRPAPTGLLRGYGEADLADGTGQAQGLPLRVF